MRRILCMICLLSAGAAGCASLSTPSHDMPPPPADLQTAGYRAGVATARAQEDDKKPNGPDMKKGNGGHEAQKITLPMAIEMCVNQNFRIRAGADRVRQAEGDLVTTSLIPNSTLFTDYQLIPLQRADINNQLGPPQADVYLTIPIDWLLFGKRIAAMRAARLGIDVSTADRDDIHRVQVGNTVDAFYDILANEKYLKLAEDSLEELRGLEALTAELAKNNKAGKLELDRIKLAVLEAFLLKHERERTLEASKARLRPLIGLSTDIAFELDGVLEVPKQVVPPPKLAEAVALAEVHRPDLNSDRFDIDRARANVTVERRRARPFVAVGPGWSYQAQQNIDGFRNGSLFNFGLTVTLPITDRNQGNILKAQARERELQNNYLGDRADALAEVETAVINYEDAVEHLGFNTPETLQAAHDLRKNTEAAYRAGTRRLDEMLLAHQAYRDRLAHVVEFASDYYRTLNRLNVAVGLKAYDLEKGPTIPAAK